MVAAEMYYFLMKVIRQKAVIGWDRAFRNNLTILSVDDKILAYLSACHVKTSLFFFICKSQ